MAGHNGDTGETRLDRIEHALELLVDDHIQFRDEHKNLVTSQVVLTDRLDRFIQATDERQKRVEENLVEITDKLNGLIGYIDHLPRPPQQQ